MISFKSAILIFSSVASLVTAQSLTPKLETAPETAVTRRLKSNPNGVVLAQEFGVNYKINSDMMSVQFKKGGCEGQDQNDVSLDVSYPQQEIFLDFYDDNTVEIPYARIRFPTTTYLYQLCSFSEAANLAEKQARPGAVSLDMSRVILRPDALEWAKTSKSIFKSSKSFVVYRKSGMQ